MDYVAAAFSTELPSNAFPDWPQSEGLMNVSFTSSLSSRFFRGRCSSAWLWPSPIISPTEPLSVAQTLSRFAVPTASTRWSSTDLKARPNCIIVQLICIDGVRACAWTIFLHAQNRIIIKLNCIDVCPHTRRNVLFAAIPFPSPLASSRR